LTFDYVKTPKIPVLTIRTSKIGTDIVTNFSYSITKKEDGYISNTHALYVHFNRSIRDSGKATEKRLREVFVNRIVDYLPEMLEKCCKQHEEGIKDCF
jgi:hypothetical protein